MYVPGMDQRKINKVSSLKLDTAVLDLEDGVALNKKVQCTCIGYELNRNVFFFRVYVYPALRPAVSFTIHQSILL